MPDEKAERPNSKRPHLDLRSQGVKTSKVSDETAGLPLDAMPGAKCITFDTLLEMPEVPETGLYLLDTTHVPLSLPDSLKEDGCTLQEDGTLIDCKQDPVTLIVFAETFQLLHNPHPHPWSSFSWNFRWRYRGGFCRDYRAWTTAEAWGPEEGGDRPHTFIEYIETRAEIGGHRSNNHCFDCAREDSYMRWDIGCFWPAHGGGSGFHYAHWADRETGFSATRTWSW
jgi:hypothetical protein